MTSHWIRYRSEASPALLTKSSKETERNNGGGDWRIVILDLWDVPQM